VTPLSVELTRDQVVGVLARLELDWGDEEDADSLLSILLARFSPTEAVTWILWPNHDLDERSPLDLLVEGRAREVFVLARREVAGDGR
jgi:hypothetical protein